MDYGNKPTDGGNLILSDEEREELTSEFPGANELIRYYVGSQEFYKRHLSVLPVDRGFSDEIGHGKSAPSARGLKALGGCDANSKGKQANENASTPHRFVFAPHREGRALLITSRLIRAPAISSGWFRRQPERLFLIVPAVIYNPELWLFSMIVSRLHPQLDRHRVRSDEDGLLLLQHPRLEHLSVPKLTEQNKADLTRCAEDILLAREAHFPATIADLYDPENMPPDLPRRPRPQRRNAGAHLHRPPLPQRHRTPREALRDVTPG